VVKIFPSDVNAMKRRILLVDGQGEPLRELCSELATRAAGWEVVRATSGAAALAALAASTWDAVVADMQLPDMSGEQLLTHVLRQFPQAHRVVLAELGDLESLLRCVNGVHQFVIKPCTPARLRDVLERAFELDVWLPNQALRRLMGHVPQLPSLPDSYNAVVRALEQPDATAESVGSLIARDPAMTAKMLRLANSAAYGEPTDDYDVVEAVREIGLENTKSCLLLAHSWSGFSKIEQAGFQVRALWTHANEVATLAEWLAKSEGVSAMEAGLARTAGLLHDIGKLVLAANLPDEFNSVGKLMRLDGSASFEVEQEVFGATHSELGGCMMGSWGLPMPVVEAVALHHHPACFLSRRFSPLTAVHVANALSRAESAEHFQALVERDYLAVLGLEAKLPAWWSAGEAERKRIRSAHV
jgi:putative nucleotidyltransferase with HDIG domain